ncbi:BrxE family protein [uncultured Lutibacter sp.]|uniref:BrxE family protein n=1 Tax=uncultured Lutibacter sp. TaxID=437739 RepID=UPI00260A0A66|nr:BrxE family protein [uncultured Lutibacter sp.]
MNKNIIKKLTDLRGAVAFLGEKNKWWNSSFFDSGSKDFLTYIFPKSKNIQLNCALDVVRQKTDAQVGANYYHLFRLKVIYEELINEQVTQLKGELFPTEKDALAVLNEIAGNLIVTDSPGPKNIGVIEELDENLIQAFAAEYLSAFKNNYIVHPYLN